MTIVERLQELNEQIKKLEEDRSNIEKQWVKDIKEESDKPKFDFYSKKGEAKLLKISNKYNYLYDRLEKMEEND